ncbi:MAG: hypothetical protein K0S80_443 [Neobacillus sp.]|nr:hypothetical protein [Neobacillus sp.]
MKILYVTTISNTINAFLIPHIKLLIEQGNQVGLAFNTVQEISPELIKLGCKVHHVEFQRSPFKKENHIAYKKIKRIVIEEGYKLVHVHTPVASFVTRFACRNIPDIKMVYTAHGFHFFKGAPKKNWFLYHSLEKIAARWTDALITMNEEDYKSAKKLKLRNSGTTFKVHGVGLDLKKFSPQTIQEKNKLRKEYGFNPQDFILINVGELCYRKHQDLLIKSLYLLKDRIPVIKLLLVGDGEMLSVYKELVKRLGLEKKVEFLGFRQDIPNLMLISDIAISTSRQEGLPVNVMEAMATGLPLVVTDCRGNRDLVSSGENGIVVDLNDSQICANAIEKLYKSKELRGNFINKSQDYIKEYSVENVLCEMKEIYSLFSNVRLREEGPNHNRSMVHNQ